MENAMRSPPPEEPARPRADYRTVVTAHSGWSTATFRNGQVIYSQDEPASTLYYVVAGTVKITVISEQGKEGILAILGEGEFFGERSLGGSHLHYNTTAVAAGDCEIARLDGAAARRAMEDDPQFLKLCLRFLIDRNRKLDADLVDQLFNSSEKRLARVLLTLANSGRAEQSSVIAVPITQETLANMVGTTRSRISQFMTKFRKLGHIDYNGEIRVYSSLLNVILEPARDDDGH
jgi:CRP/FNR family cyclic AMP-dependent transcriptional regulator